MTKDTRIWTVILIVGLAMIGLRCLIAGGVVGKAYVQAVTTTYVNLDDTGASPRWAAATSTEAKGVDAAALPADRRMEWTTYQPATPGQYAQAEAAAQAAGTTQSRYSLSLARTAGIWFAAFLTLAIFSFLYKDNVLYKTAEAIFIGVSAAYWMVVSFHTTIIPNLFGKIWPEWVMSWAMPGLKEQRNLLYVVPLILGFMLLWRLAPKGAWIARWPLALFIGVFCGLRLMVYLHGDFLNQIRNAIVPLYALDEAWSFDPWESLRNIFLVVGVLTCLVYFFFSFEHRGVVGYAAKVGIWVLMITFGAGFGYTVMGRIALLAIRLEFLVDDWLWLIDPTDKRVGLEALMRAGGG